jgi:acyl carrier protein phosphodiesterase
MLARMNWLAHVFLSADDIEFQLGNLLADVVRGPDLAGMSPRFVLGAQRHRAIDSFTDAHPVVRRSRMRLGPEHRRFSGVLMDVFYDYFLATRWDAYSSTPLDEFTSRFYSDARASGLALPDPAQRLIDRMIQHDLLGQYRSIHGVEQSLHRLSLLLASRWHRPFALERSIPMLLANESLLAADFAEFFPELRLNISRSDGSKADIP